MTGGTERPGGTDRPVLLHGTDRPVVLLHGTNDTAATMRPLADALRAAGRPVVALDYGRHRRSLRGRLGSGGLAPLAASTAQILAGIDTVLGLAAPAARTPDADAAAAGTPATDAPAAGTADAGRADAGTAPPAERRVDLVGHSQGGLHALACARARPGRVAHVVLLGSPVLGVRPLGAASRVAHAPGVRHALDALLGPAAREQVLGSAALRDHVPRPTRPTALGPGADGPRYLYLASRHDWALRHVDPQLLASRPGWRTVWLEDLPPDGPHAPPQRVDHAALPGDPRVIALVLHELSRTADGDG